MKYCSNCGQPLREGVKVCTNCGKPVQQSKTNHSNTQQDHHNQSRQDKHEQHQYQGYNNHNQNGYADRHDQQPRKGDNKKTWIIIAVIAVLLIALIVAFSVLKNQFSPEKQASNIAQAIKKDDEKALAKEVTTQNDQKLSKQEARAYLNYIKTEDDSNNVGSNVEQSAKEIKDNRYNNLSVDTNENSVLNISKDGKKFLFFDNYSFNVPQKSVSIYPSSSGDITYEYNGKKRTTTVTEDDEKTLGTFPIGDYNLKATKDIDGKKFKGALMINMSDDATAYESFKQKRFTVSVDGGYMLNNVKIYANDKEIGSESSSETFGPYDPDEEVTVYAQGTYEGKTFKSDSVNVTSSGEDDDDVTDVTVTFDDDEIDKYIDDKMDAESDSDSDDSDSSSGEVTRDNVIDKVESYEGHTLDTDTYTYKEPEKTDDGKWGFSFTDKDGDLAGSYTVDTDDGYVTEYDEDGEEVGSGY
ncbi:zinc-ribbon domain-containing protein [Staphylococcus haemolyticus]|uniref:zinc ribbon domain-containing protein n=1 Tax=Staphylococcus TaxID=1279 RepID=UPI000D1EE605|nr:MULTISPECIES: zinc ribbon domain-containing protein [Staphylococcus]MCE4963938.1 zinc-ribbon domain-containing protein [Staphylococcus haemolyticus]MCE4987957.1 zinc-ribbon domain-containing protein [Staphylococcus haemolyticus]MCE4992195.1 zinc-ribbon domain-containing protein [Staphylococcus haemolyticus]MCE5036578.1 zinc-ribbon domain-containing protein [Staphylococcus haemolyticus]MCE5050761.1 zinc-ribbon domain-containing protein [Staphylococcus haemolyticus]